MRNVRALKPYIVGITFFVSWVIFIIVASDNDIALFVDHDELVSYGRYVESDSGLTGKGLFLIYLSAYLAARVHLLFENAQLPKIRREKFLWNGWMVYLFLAVGFSETLKCLHFHPLISLGVTALYFFLTGRAFAKILAINKAKLSLS